MKQKEKSKILANACYLCGGKFALYMRRMIECGYIEKYLGIGVNAFYKKKKKCVFLVIMALFMACFKKRGAR